MSQSASSPARAEITPTDRFFPRLCRLSLTTLPPTVCERYCLSFAHLFGRGSPHDRTLLSLYRDSDDVWECANERSSFRYSGVTTVGIDGAWTGGC